MRQGSKRLPDWLPTTNNSRRGKADKKWERREQKCTVEDMTDWRMTVSWERFEGVGSEKTQNG